MLCPTCKTALTMSERQGIEIDYCPSCRGVWLDRGELDKIIERNVPTRVAGAEAPGPYGHDRHWDDDRRHHYGYRGKRKNFLKELFD